MVIDLGSISGRSQSDLGSRVDLGSISGRSRVDIESISSRSRSTEIKITSSSSDLPVKSIGRVSLLRRDEAQTAALGTANSACGSRGMSCNFPVRCTLSVRRPRKIRDLAYDANVAMHVAIM